MAKKIASTKDDTIKRGVTDKQPTGRLVRLSGMGEAKGLQRPNGKPRWA